MADIFISYAREDITFVRRLFDTLEADGRDVSIDWKEIPPAADWLMEIYAAIEAADSFVFVISPESVTSEVCNKEVAHAISHNKRLVPIIHREIDETANFESLVGVDWEADAKNNWGGLKRLNWLFFRAGDDFNAAFQALRETLDTDLEWVKAHTKLLMRAREWENQGKNDSFALRGVDLDEAEKWLAQPRQNPEPTPLQREYVLASRQGTIRRQRLTLTVVTIGLVVAIALAIMAYFNWVHSK